MEYLEGFLCMMVMSLCFHGNTEAATNLTAISDDLCTPVFVSGDPAILDSDVQLTPKCCEENCLWFDLTTGEVEGCRNPSSNPENPYFISWRIRRNRQYPDKNCSRVLLAQPWFHRVPECYGCVKQPMCGRRMFRMDFYLHPGERGGYMFNVADAKDADGWGGDPATTSHNAETFGFYPHGFVYGSADCNNKFLEFLQDALAATITQLTIYISNDFVRITNDNGMDVSMCSDCLYTLDGTPDTSGVKDDKVYVGVNRVVSWTADRYGYGVCYVKMSWACPWCE